MHSKARQRSAALALTFCIALGGCFSDEDDGTGPNGNGNGNGGDVVVVNMNASLQFQPAHVEIRAGQTIRWVNTSNFPHTSTANVSLALDPSSVALPSGAQAWHSEDIDPGGTFERTLTVTGDYTYFCDPHESQGMVGTITVVE